MELERHVDGLREQLGLAAEAGGEEAREVAERLTAPLDSAVRLMLLEVLAAAAAEITQELAPGSVELRLRGRDEAEFVVTSPSPRSDEAAADAATVTEPGGGESATVRTGEGGVARVNLRLPDELKARVEQAADREGLSINTWLVRAAAAAVERAQGGPASQQRSPSGSQRYSGWGR